MPPCQGTFGCYRQMAAKEEPTAEGKGLPGWVARRKRRVTGRAMPGEGGDGGSVYAVPSLGEGTKAAGHGPSSPCSSDAERSRSQVTPALCKCMGLEKTHVLLVWQRGPGLPGPKGAGVAFAPCLHLLSSSEV